MNGPSRSLLSLPPGGRAVPFGRPGGTEVKRAKKTPLVAAAEDAQPRRALAAARQGWRARQVDGGEAARGQGCPRARGARSEGIRMTRWPHHPDTLSRRDLEENRMRDLYTAVVDPSLAFSDLELSASLTATLAAKPKGAGWWVFAYGSLLWNPLFPVAEMRPAKLNGLHRRFCLWSLASRGTRDCPGLVLGLDRGGAVSRCRDATAGHARDRRAAPPVAARDGRRVVSPALGEGRRRRPRSRGADVRRPARPSAVRSAAYARRTRPTCWPAPAARSARRSITSSARAWRWSRTASSTRTSKGLQPGSRHDRNRTAADRNAPSPSRRSGTRRRMVVDTTFRSAGLALAGMAKRFGRLPIRA